MKPVRAWSIHTQLTMVVLIAVLPALGIIVYYAAEQRESAIREARQDCEWFLEKLHDNHEHQVAVTRQLLGSLATDPAVKRQDATACTELFKRLHAENPQYTTISAVDRSGRMFSSAFPFKDVQVADRKYFQDAVRTKKFSAGEYAVARVVPKPVFHFASPVLDSKGEVSAVVLAPFDLSRFDHVLADAELPAGSRLKLFDGKGICVFSSTGSDWIGKPDRPISFKSMQEGGASGHFSIVDEQGDKRYCAFRKYRLSPRESAYLYMRVSFPESVIVADARRVLARAICLVAMALLLALGASWLVGRYGVILRLRRLVDAAHAMGKGQFAARTGIEHAGNEFNQLARVFDEMGESIQAHEANRQGAEAVLRWNEARLQALVQLNQMIDAPVQAITDFALEAAVRLTQSTVGYVAFLNQDETVLTMNSWSKDAMAECAIADKPLVYPVVATGLWGEAVRQRKAVVTNDYAVPSPWKKGYPDGHVQLLRHMNAPVFDRDRIVIVAGVGNKIEPYDDSDVRQLTLLMQGLWQLLERKRAADAIRDSLTEKTVLLKEVHHRVKNNLQIVCSLLSLQSLRTKQAEALDALKDTTSRVRSMSLLHEALYRSGNLAQVDFAAYIDSICSHLFRAYGSRAAEIRFERRFENVRMELDQAISCGLIVNELVSNALKHAFPEGRAGRIAVAFEQTPDGRVTLAVSDDGVGLPPNLDLAAAETLGHQLVQMLAEKLGAKVEILRNGETAFRIVFVAKAEGKGGS